MQSSPRSSIPKALDGLVAEAFLEARRRRTRVQVAVAGRSVLSPDGSFFPFHRAQDLTYDCPRRIVGMFAGTQGGKTGFGPWWSRREIREHGRGDYLAVTATYDLFHLKMLPSLLEVFEHTLRIGRYWGADRLIEIADENGRFWAHKATDPMWARIILRSAESVGGLESATAKGAWLDEAGQPSFTLEAWHAILRRLALNRGRILITTSLFDVGWLDTEVLQKAKDGGKTMVEMVGEGEIEVTDNPERNIGLVQFDSIINPLFPLDEFEARRESMPADEFEASYRGRRIPSKTLIYDCFDRIENTCPRFDIPEDWPRYLGIDPGGTHMAAEYFAEEPGTQKLFWYRDYLEGGRTSKEHVEAMLDGEPGRPVCYGGAGSEDQWRREFAAAGLGVQEPPISDFDVGIQRMYATLKQRKVVIFEDLTSVIADLQKYRRKRDRQGNVTKQVEAKESFHRLDGARYILSSIRPDRPKAKVVRLG